MGFHGLRPKEFMSQRPYRAIALIFFTAIFGAVMFLAGRYSVPRTIFQTISPPANTVAAAPEKSPVHEVTSGKEENKRPSVLAGWQESDWQQLSGQLRTPARVTALATMLEKLAATDSQRALFLAQAEGNLKTRDLFTQAVLRGWAGTAPDKAADWALNLADDNAREAAMASVFAGAVANPDAAIRVAGLAADKDPDNAIGFGNSLIDTFCEAGNFEAAARFAGNANAGQRSFLLAEAYSKWSALQPEPAAQAALAISDPDTRSEALHGIVGGWSAADPVALTHFIAQLPAGGERGAMLGQALQSWVRVDPIAASQWMNASDKGADMDEGVASVARMNELKPEVAIGWAESITDKNLRSEVLGEVLRSWVLENPTVARHYFDATSDLLPTQRQEIRDILTTADQLTNVPSQPGTAN